MSRSGCDVSHAASPASAESVKTSFPVGPNATRNPGSCVMQPRVWKCDAVLARTAANLNASPSRSSAR